MKMLFLFRRYGGIVGFQDAAFRRADELYDFVAYLALGKLCHHDIACAAVVVAVLEEHPEDILYFAYLFGSEAAAAESDEVGSYEGDGETGGLYERRDVFRHKRTAAYHGMAADADELVYGRCATHDGPVAYFDFAGNMDMAIAIRTAFLRDHEASVQAGAGIVLDSVPATEWQETRNKAEASVESIQIAAQLREL